MKGAKGEECNVTACQRPDSAFYWNRVMDAHYCKECALDIQRCNVDLDLYPEIIEEWEKTGEDNMGATLRSSEMSNLYVMCIVHTYRKRVPKVVVVDSVPSPGRHIPEVVRGNHDIIVGDPTRSDLTEFVLELREQTSCVFEDLNPCLKQIQYGPQKRGKKGKVKRW